MANVSLPPINQVAPNALAAGTSQLALDSTSGPVGAPGAQAVASTGGEHGNVKSKKEEKRGGNKHGKKPMLAAVAQMALAKKKMGGIALVANTNAVNVVKDKAMYRAEREINLNHFRELLMIFKRASKNGKQSMGIEEFKEAFGIVLGEGLTEQQMKLLFMQIDANTDNTVDWDEFSTFMLLRAERQSKMLEEASTQLFDVPNPLLSIPKVMTPHRESIVNIIFLPASSRYVTCSREGTVCYWSDKLKMQSKRRNKVDELEDRKAKNSRDRLMGKNEAPWINDFLFMPNVNKFAMSSDDHEISFFDYSTMECQLRLDLYDTVALTMDFWFDTENPDADESMLLYGTDQGYVNIFNFVNSRVFRKATTKRVCEVINMETLHRNPVTKQYGTLSKRKAHNDWVLKVRYYHDLHAIVSCSADPLASLVVATQDGKNKWNLFSAPVHRGVNTFAYCRFPVSLVTGGTDRQLRLWNPHRLHHPMAALKGHNAPIIDITVNEMSGQILSLSADSVVKVWDIRKLQCLQTLVVVVHATIDDAIGKIHFTEELEGKMIAASNSLTVYNLKGSHRTEAAKVSVKTHDYPLLSALFNPSFKQVVTGCYGGVINVWDSSTGLKTFRFAEAHGKSEITAMAFDTGFRRLLTGGRDGTVYMWNFHNGQLLRELVKGDRSEVTGIICMDMNDDQFIAVTGWNRKVTLFRDETSQTKLLPYAVYPSPSDPQGYWHKDDIISIGFCKPNILVTGSYDGEIVVSNIQSGHIMHRLRWPGCEDKMNPNRSIDQVLILRERLSNPSAASLVSTGSDGILRWWNLETGELVWEMDTTEKGEGVFAMCTDPRNITLVTGNSTGFITIYDISSTCIDNSTMEVHWPVVLASFRCHLKSIVSVEYVESDFLVTASVDGTARMFTMNGQYIGTFGQETLWDINVPETYPANPKPPDVLLKEHHEKVIGKFQNMVGKVIRRISTGDPAFERRSAVSATASTNADADPDDAAASYTASFFGTGTNISSNRTPISETSGYDYDDEASDEDEDEDKDTEVSRWSRRDVKTADLTACDYRTWYAKSNYAKELHKHNSSQLRIRIRNQARNSSFGSGSTAGASPSNMMSSNANYTISGSSPTPHQQPTQSAVLGSASSTKRSSLLPKIPLEAAMSRTYHNLHPSELADVTLPSVPVTSTGIVSMGLGRNGIRHGNNAATEAVVQVHDDQRGSGRLKKMASRNHLAMVQRQMTVHMPGGGVSVKLQREREREKVEGSVAAGIAANSGPALSVIDRPMTRRTLRDYIFG
ncbi:hypothetical protein HDU76_013215 [Blyttiomyces sp. JEL0837]|nr:hypothetical protein HDU76_013215 [Blyttiomyces sp. JEL0837]